MISRNYKFDLTVDSDVERTGHHIWRRLWSLRSQVQLSLTAQRRTAVVFVQSGTDCKRHVSWRSDHTDVTVCAPLERTASYLH